MVNALYYLSGHGISYHFNPMFPTLEELRILMNDKYQ